MYIFGYSIVSLALIGVNLLEKLSKVQNGRTKALKARKGQVKNDHLTICCATIFGHSIVSLALTDTIFEPGISLMIDKIRILIQMKRKSCGSEGEVNPNLTNESSE